MFLSACAVSSISSPFKSGSADDAASSVNADRLLENAKADNGQDAASSGAAAHCPQIVAWPYDRLLTVYEPGHNGDSLSIVHRGEITKTARECQLEPGRVTVGAPDSMQSTRWRSPSVQGHVGSISGNTSHTPAAFRYCSKPWGAQSSPMSCNTPSVP